MGDHSAPESTWQKAGAFVWTHRRKILSGLIIALPLVARVVPEFPANEVLSLVRVFLGA